MLSRKTKIKKLSIILLSLLVANMLAFAFNIQPVKASTIIYIRADGNVDPPNEPILRNEDLYIFNGNIYDAIIVERDNIIIDGNGYTLQGSGPGTGICLSGRKNVTIQNTTINNFDYGITLGGLDCSSSYNNINGNNITANNFDGVYLDYSSNYNIISENIIAENNNGIYLYCSSNNKITRNNIISNDYEGISLSYSSSYNSISGNNIANSWYGITLERSSNNIIYHNNFLYNTYQIHSSASINTWNNGNPSAGNYWSDYNGIDNDGDGIGYTPYIIDADNSDHFPVTVQYNEFPEAPLQLMIVHDDEGKSYNANSTTGGTPPAQEEQPLEETSEEPKETIEEDTVIFPEEELPEETSPKEGAGAFLWILGITLAVIGSLFLWRRRK
jgi:parallel beta-helix repeat protein